MLSLLAGCGAREATDTGAPRMRPAEQGAASAVYLTLRNPSPDTLVLRRVEIDVAGAATLHESLDHDGMASMMHRDSVVVLPNDSMAFRERGLHIMATDLHTPIVVGDTVVMRLVFASARVDTIRVPVRE